MLLARLSMSHTAVAAMPGVAMVWSPWSSAQQSPSGVEASYSAAFNRCIKR
jgi:hypothetical protein